MIWHTNIKPVKDKQILFFAGGSRFPYLGWYNPSTDSIDSWWFERDVTKWAYMEDILDLIKKEE